MKIVEKRNCAWGPCGKIIPVERYWKGPDTPGHPLSLYCSDECKENNRKWEQEQAREAAANLYRVSFNIAERLKINSQTNNITQRITCEIQDAWCDTSGNSIPDLGVIVVFFYGDTILITIDLCTLKLMDQTEAGILKAIDILVKNALSEHLIGEEPIFELEDCPDEQRDRDAVRRVAP